MNWTDATSSQLTINHDVHFSLTRPDIGGNGSPVHKYRGFPDRNAESFRSEVPELGVARCSLDILRKFCQGFISPLVIQTTSQCFTRHNRSVPIVGGAPRQDCGDIGLSGSSDNGRPRGIDHCVVQHSIIYPSWYPGSHVPLRLRCTYTNIQAPFHYLVYAQDHDQEGEINCGCPVETHNRGQVLNGWKQGFSCRRSSAVHLARNAQKACVSQMVNILKPSEQLCKSKRIAQWQC